MRETRLPFPFTIGVAQATPALDVSQTRLLSIRPVLKLTASYIAFYTGQSEE
jgi:hypothetical protein